MLNETTCNNILSSNIWKTWDAQRIVRLQFESEYRVVPDDALLVALKILFKTENLPSNLSELVPGYQKAFPYPLTLKEILSWLPKKMYFTRIK